MPLTSYAELKTEIATALNITGGSTTFLDTVIPLAEKQIWNDLRIKEMEQSLSATISSDVVQLPTDFIDLKFAYYTDSANQDYWLDYRQAEFITRNYLRDFPRAKPEYIATEGQKFIFGPLPDQSNYILHGIYYRRLSALTSASVTDTVFLIHPELYLMKSCALGERWLGRPQRIGEWDSIYQQLKMSINQENKQGTGYTVPHY